MYTPLSGVVRINKRFISREVISIKRDEVNISKLWLYQKFKYCGRWWRVIFKNDNYPYLIISSVDQILETGEVNGKLYEELIKLPLDDNKKGFSVKDYKPIIEFISKYSEPLNSTQETSLLKSTLNHLFLKLPESKSPTPSYFDHFRLQVVIFKTLMNDLFNKQNQEKERPTFDKAINRDLFQEHKSKIAIDIPLSTKIPTSELKEVFLIEPDTLLDLCYFELGLDYINKASLKVCVNCGNTFIEKNLNRRYCNECRKDAENKSLNPNYLYRKTHEKKTPKKLRKRTS